MARINSRKSRAKHFTLPPESCTYSRQLEPLTIAEYSSQTPSPRSFAFLFPHRSYAKLQAFQDTISLVFLLKSSYGRFITSQTLRLIYEGGKECLRGQRQLRSAMT